MQKPSFEGLLIDSLTAEDLERVVEIEKQEPSGWNSEMIRSELLTENGVQLSARLSGTVVGWACGRWTGEEAELLKIAVNNRYRRQKLGTVLLDRLVSLCADAGAVKLFLEVRSMNRAAVRFYKRYGFTEVGRRKGYYKEPSDDAVIMETNLPEKGVEGKNK